MNTAIIEKLQWMRRGVVLQKHSEVTIANVLKSDISNHSILHSQTENFILDKSISFRNVIRVFEESGGYVDRRERKYTVPLQWFYGQLNYYQLTDTEKNKLI